MTAGPGKVLVVDDNDAGRYVKRRILEQAGHSVIEARVADSFHVQIDEVAEKRTLRQIRAGIVRLPIGDRVQRIQRHKRRPRRSKSVDHGLQIGKISAAPIAS